MEPAAVRKDKRAFLTLTATLACNLQPAPSLQHLDPSFYLRQHHRLAGGSRERSLAGGLWGWGAVVRQHYLLLKTCHAPSVDGVDPVTGGPCTAAAA